MATIIDSTSEFLSNLLMNYLSVPVVVAYVNSLRRNNVKMAW
jgi:hypothetical protein